MDLAHDSIMLIKVFSLWHIFVCAPQEQTEEYVGGEMRTKLGDCFIRGNNGEIEIDTAQCPRRLYRKTNMLICIAVLYISPARKSD